MVFDLHCLEGTLALNINGIEVLEAWGLITSSDELDDTDVI